MVVNELNPKAIGNITELEVLLYLQKMGITVSIPHGDNARYDQIWDVGGKLLKIQIKSSKISSDGSYITINCKSITLVHGKHIKRDYKQDNIDAIVSFHNGKVYYIPIEIAPSSQINLRFAIPANMQNTNIHWAAEFELERQMSLMKLM